MGAELGSHLRPPRLGPGAQRQKLRGHLSPSACACPVSWVVSMWQLPQSWTQRPSAARTSSWWGPVSSRPPPYLGPKEVRLMWVLGPSLGGPPQAWATSRFPGRRNILTELRCLGRGSPHPQAWLFNISGKVEGRGWLGQDLPAPVTSEISLWYSLLAVKITDGQKGPLLNFLFQIRLRMKSRLTSEP